MADKKHLSEKTDKVKDEGIYVSEQEMEDLGEFLGTIQQYLLSHEARIGALEEFATELMLGKPTEPEGDVADEPANDSPEG